jgi:hypothetical protein
LSCETRPSPRFRPGASPWTTSLPPHLAQFQGLVLGDRRPSSVLPDLPAGSRRRKPPSVPFALRGRPPAHAGGGRHAKAGCEERLRLGPVPGDADGRREKMAVASRGPGRGRTRVCRVSCGIRAQRCHQGTRACPGAAPAKSRPSLPVWMSEGSPLGIPACLGRPCRPCRRQARPGERGRAGGGGGGTPLAAFRRGDAWIHEPGASEVAGTTPCPTMGTQDIKEARTGRPCGMQARRLRRESRPCEAACA